MNPQKLIAAVIGALLIIIVAILSYTTVDAGHYGVVKRFGAVTGTTFAPGLHFKTPFVDTVDHVDVRLASVNADVAAGSRDQQEVRVVLAMQYFLNPSVTPKMIDGLGTRPILEAAVLSSALQESGKAVTALYTAEQLLTERPKVKIGINEAVHEYVDQALRDKGLSGLVRVANIAVIDVDFSEEFNKAIEAKVKAQQEAEQAKADKDKKITQAEADNAKKKLEADANAYQTAKEAEARAQAIIQEGEALQANPSVIELRLAERWNGVLPIANGGVLPFLDLGKFMGPHVVEQQPSAAR